jgi:membrane protease YdiL (CAAX protease family)
MAILAAGMSCWVLAALKVRSGLPLVEWSPRRMVPWALVDLIPCIVLYIVVSIAAAACLQLLGLLPADGREKDLSLPGKTVVIWAQIATSCALLALILPLVAWRSGASVFDLGFSLRDLWPDLKLGLIGFVMLAPPVYAIQGVLVHFWQPSQHPLMEMFKSSPDAGFFAILVIAAAVVAPVFEEVVFRVLLQGFLEKACSRRVTARDLLLGSPISAVSSADALLEASPFNSQDAREAAPSATLLPVAPASAADPYLLPPAIIAADSVVDAELADEAAQPPLRGPRSWLPIVISSIIFALMHFTHGPDWVALTLLAAGMGYLYQRTHRIIPSLIVHALLNSLSMFGLWLQVYGPPEFGAGQ